jgi:hypothetical protein
MTDRELLELSAKAAGLAYEWNECSGAIEYIPAGHTGYSRWNPLYDDGDALRLAVKLHLELSPACYSRDRVDVYSRDNNHVSEPHGDDPYAATRRAIVRAAAAIGAARE